MKGTKSNKQRKMLIMFAMIIVGFLTIGQSNVFSQTPSGKGEKIIRPVILEVEAKGPGALFIAPLNDGIGVWVINGDKATPAGTVKYAEGKQIPNRWIIKLSNGIRAIFYADNLPLGNDLKMSFSGNLENRDCPLCTVSMPLSLQTPLERRDVKYYEQILSYEATLKSVDYYEKLGNQMEDIYLKRIEIRKSFPKQ